MSDATTANPLVCPACGATRVLALAPGDVAGPDGFDCSACGATNAIEAWQCCAHCAYGRRRCGRAEARLAARRPGPDATGPDATGLEATGLDASVAKGRGDRSERRPPGWSGLLQALRH